MTDNKFIERRLPPRREDLSVDDLTDLVKYNFAIQARAIAELQHKLAELVGTGKLDPEANEELQFGWCVNACESLYYNTTSAIRRTHDTSDEDWNEHDNTYANGLQVMHHDPPQIAQDDWEFNEHLVDDGPIYEYRHHAVYHIAEPPFYADGRGHDRLNFDIPDLSDIPEAALAIHGELVRRQVEGIVPTHMDEKGMAAHFGLTREEVREHCALLTARGLVHKATDGLTEGQLRVLYALPDRDPDNPAAGITNRQLAERLGMDIQEVKQHMRVLDDLGWTQTPPKKPRA